MLKDVDLQKAQMLLTHYLGRENANQNIANDVGSLEEIGSIVEHIVTGMRRNVEFMLATMIEKAVKRALRSILEDLLRSMQ